jgi:hypothetical protein
MLIRPEFINALQDYLFLLEKGYPQKATLKLVSDRYRLNTGERSMLFRGVVTAKDRKSRSSKTIDTLPETGLLSIDGFNVLRTVASYLLGRPVYVAMDGFLRDASELHGKPLKTEYRIKAFELVMDLIRNKDLTLRIWFDSPVSKSGETAAIINNLMKEAGIKGEAQTVHSADHELKQVKTGIVATADSAVIDKAQVPVIDLAKMTLKAHFKKELIDLGKLAGIKRS